ncbi:hypothetical protein AIIKEEIJ_01749 [Rhodococcus sp. YH1]|nr:hypothetical protein [Rhodococcus sp. YH1]
MSVSGDAGASGGTAVSDNNTPGRACPRRVRSRPARDWCRPSFLRWAAGAARSWRESALGAAGRSRYPVDGSRTTHALSGGSDLHRFRITTIAILVRTPVHGYRDADAETTTATCPAGRNGSDHLEDNPSRTPTGTADSVVRALPDPRHHLQPAASGHRRRRRSRGAPEPRRRDGRARRAARHRQLLGRRTSCRRRALVQPDRRPRCHRTGHRADPVVHGCDRAVGARSRARRRGSVHRRSTEPGPPRDRHRQGQRGAPVPPVRPRHRQTVRLPHRELRTAAPAAAGGTRRLVG